MPSTATPSHSGPDPEEENGGLETNFRVAVKCGECGEREAKYRCPGCGLRSCGLNCVKSHKERTQCTGKRKRTSFVPVSEYDDNLLISDYNLLEEISRQADAAKRLRTPLGDVKTDAHPAVQALQRQAKGRSTTVLCVANGMSKRKANTSYYDRKTKRIFWRIEWTFEGTDIQLVDAKVDENLILDNLLEKLLTSEKQNGVVKHRLRNFCWRPIHELKLLLPKEPCSAEKRVFHELNLKKSLRDQLAHKRIVEYPTFHVLLPEDLGKYTIETQETWEIEPQEKLKVKTEDLADALITPTFKEPEGIPFREEEIEEGEFVP